MAGWDWLAKHHYTLRFVRNVILRAGLLFVTINLLFVALDPMSWLGSLTLYNGVFPGRPRLPYADNPTEAYNISLTRLDAMFASHVIADDPVRDDAFRVVLIGDSSVWGWLLEPDETLSACINAGGYTLDDGRRIRAYNLGYPITNASKDLLILDYALRYQPDAVIWFVTMEGLYRPDQFDHPIMSDNRQQVLNLVERFGLDLDTGTIAPEPDLWQQTFIGQRRDLADLIRHQIYGVAWTHTGIDHINPRFFRPPVRDLPASEGMPNRGYLDAVGADNLTEYLALDVIEAGVQLAPTLVVNEPIYLSAGANSDLRYNHLYPRWAYDSYREAMVSLDVTYLDLWDFVLADEFTDYFPLHYNAEATCDVAERLIPEIVALSQS